MRTLLSVIIILTGASPSFAAIAAASVIEVRTAGTDTNGAGYVTGSSGTDMSLFDNKNAAACTSCQSATVNISTADAVTAGTTTITSVSGNYSSALIGNLVYIQGGTGSVTAVWKQVITVPGSTSFTVDSSTGLTAGTGVTVNIGGALLSPSIAANVAGVAGNTVFIKAGTYTISSNSTATANGAILSAVTTSIFVGYSSSRTFGNTDTQPILQTSGSTITPVQSGNTFYNITFDGNAQTASRLTSVAANFIYCTIKGFNTTNGTQITSCIGCLFTANTVSQNATYVAFSEAYANTATPFIAGACVWDLAYSNTGATTDGFACTSITANSISVANGRDGYRQGGTIVNSHAQSNTGFGYKTSSTGALKVFTSTGFGNSALTDTSVAFFSSGLSAVSGDVFTAIGSNDYSLNNIASQGAALRSAGRFPILRTFPRGLTSGYVDIGPAQHQDPVTGSATP